MFVPEIQLDRSLDGDRCCLPTGERHCKKCGALMGQEVVLPAVGEESQLYPQGWTFLVCTNVQCIDSWC